MHDVLLSLSGPCSSHQPLPCSRLLQDGTDLDGTPVRAAGCPK
jgi:hypothetical protein